MRELTRRDLLLGASLAGVSCTKAPPKAEEAKTTLPPLPPPQIVAPAKASDNLVKAVWEQGDTRVEEWELADQSQTPTRIAVLIPKAAVAATDASLKKYPVLIALHGRGEALKKPPDGALGWAKDYDLLLALRRIEHPPLTDSDFQGFSDPSRLRKMNEALTSRAYGGMIVVCPYLPDLDLRQEAGMQLYGEYLVNMVLPLVRARLPASTSPKSTGIDGVSLGGAVGLFVGLTFAEVFGSVGGLQPAIQSADAELWAKRVHNARAKNDTQTLRLLTSTKDYFREGIGRLSSILRSRKLVHEYLDVPGPHDYIFNRGPGAYELLYFHERAFTKP